tara:strand:- start:301 stop:618 length:318 start_codon:yes stop_codon:yes gene_type:complete
MEPVYSPTRSIILLKEPRKEIKGIIDRKKLRSKPLSKEGFKVILDEVSFKEQINHNQVTLGMLIPENQNCDQSLESIKEKTLSEFLNMQMSNVKVRIFKTNYQFM